MQRICDKAYISIALGKLSKRIILPSQRAKLREGISHCKNSLCKTAIVEDASVNVKMIVSAINASIVS